MDYLTYLLIAGTCIFIIGMVLGKMKDKMKD